MLTVSIVTPWHNHPELITGYAAAVEYADQVIVVDNASESQCAAELYKTAVTNDWTLIANAENRWFTGANNQGLEVATGDIVVFLNDDVEAPPTWIDAVRAEVPPNALVGPSVLGAQVDGVVCPYVEGWCIAARRETWAMLGGWDAEAFPRPYYEDTWLSFHARTLGCSIVQSKWNINHLSNVTSKTTVGAYDHSERNRATYEAKVRAWLAAHR